MQNNYSPLTESDRPEKCARITQAGRRSKADAKFWTGRVFKPLYRKPDGQKAQSANYAVELCVGGHRIKWSLGTPNREAAAARAKELYLFICANGWEAARERYRPKAAPQKRPGPEVTVGAFLAAVQALGLLSAPTFADYREALRRIVSEIAGVPGSGRYRFSAEHDARLARIAAIKLREITPQKIEGWKRAFLASAKSDPISQRSARVSANSYLKRAKCLFSRRILKSLGDEVPNPFVGVEFERKPSLRYHSSFDIRLLVAKATEELALPPNLELFKIFVLAALCGLRRREIDLLPWRAFRWDEGVLRIEATEFFRPKSEESIADIPLDPEVLALFRGYHARASSQFVIESDLEPKPGAVYLHYRCFRMFEALCEWLRAHDVKTIRPLHTLRKEFGSLINRAYGIHAASRALRHSSIGITSEIYLDSKIRVTSGLGSLLGDQTQNILPLCVEEPPAHRAEA